MKVKQLPINKAYYNAFGVCLEFRQRLMDLQRLKKANKQELEAKDVKEEE